MRIRPAIRCSVGGLTVVACNALTGASDLGVAGPNVALPDGSRTEDDGASTMDAAPPIDSEATDAAVADVVEEDAPTDPSLIGFWTFDEPTGTTSADKSGKGRDATLSNGASFGPNAGIRGGAVSLGTGMSVMIEGLSGADFPITGTFSIWLRWRTMDVATHHGIVDQWADARNHLYLRHANQAPSGELQIAFQPMAAPYVWAHSFVVAQDTWAHVVVTWSDASGRAAAFMNGTKMKDAAYSAAFKPDQQIMRLGNNFDGWLDEMRLYDRALSDAEAAAIP